MVSFSRSRRVRLVLLVAVACQALSLISCGGGTRLHPVQGQVVYRSQPAAGALIVFFPVKDEGTLLPQGEVGPDGSFTLTCVSADGKPREGAPEGEYIVTITWPKELPKPKKTGGFPAEKESPPDRLEGRYSKARSQLRAHIKAGSNKLEPFTIN